MSVDIIGMIQSQKQSEIHPPDGPVIDRDYVRAFAQAHEQAGFDRILVPHHSTGPSATLTISYAATVTERIHFMLAHRPGFTAPTLAARQIATLDQFSGGRLGVHFISGGSDDEQRRDGDYLDHDQRYARTDEYLASCAASGPRTSPSITRARSTASSAASPKSNPPSSHMCRSTSAVLPRQHSPWPANMPTSTRCGANPRPGTRADHARACRGRQACPRGAFLGVVPARAGGHRGKGVGPRRQHPGTHARVARAGRLQPWRPAAERGARRLLAAADKGDRVDQRLWTAIARETGGRSNSTGLVGTPEQVADALLAYYDLGVSTFLLRGFDPLDDAVDYGRELIPRVRALVAQRDAERQRKAA
jgi:alkanesulfonate monooxygenase